MQYCKLPLDFEQQLDRLIERGLIVTDREKALHYLSHINYYRLAGYVLPFEADHARHVIRGGTRFDDVINLYVFDRELRLLVLDALERVEVSVRTQWAYHLSHATHAHGYLDVTNATSAKTYTRQLALVERAVDRSREVFIKHHKEKYTSPDLPPTWVACEVMSLGEISQWYGLLNPIALRKRIAAAYGLDQQVLGSALRHLSYVRNICAHHSRLWNREFVITFKAPRKGAELLRKALPMGESRQLYATACLLVYLLDRISPRHSWPRRLAGLIDEYKVDTGAMGFPKDWRTHALWMMA